VTIIKSILSIIIFGFVISENYAQDKSLELLEKANHLFENKNYKGALEIYNDIVFNYEKSEVFPLALYNKAKTLETINDLDLAITIYKKFLVGAYDDEMIIDANFMSNPYANFSNNSAMSIAKISYDKGNYQRALDYYNLADTVYSYKTSCGNDAMDNYYELILLKAQCLEKLERDDDAVKLCVKYIFKGFLASTDEIVQYLIRLIDKKYSKEEFVETLLLSLNNIYKSNFGKNNNYKGFFF
jgi:tetratricopeptide (TPR) repeat protein